MIIEINGVRKKVTEEQYKKLEKLKPELKEIQIMGYTFYVISEEVLKELGIETPEIE